MKGLTILEKNLIRRLLMRKINNVLFLNISLSGAILTGVLLTKQTLKMYLATVKYQIKGEIKISSPDDDKASIIATAKRFLSNKTSIHEHYEIVDIEQYGTIGPKPVRSD